MAKIKTIDEFTDSLTSDFNWRVKEISNFKASIKGAVPQHQAAMLRAGVPLTYAHWEGHIAHVTRSYTSYVLSKRVVYSKLKVSFSLHAFGRRFDQMYGKKLSLSEKIEFLEDFKQVGAVRFSLADGDVFKTRSNLNSEVLQELCRVTNVDIANFSPHFDFIDKFLVGRRNFIAHGQDISLSVDDFEDLTQKTIQLMRNFRDLVENEAQTSGYLL
jgi:MAE_28990/MAE_18760-like HEPN